MAYEVKYRLDFYTKLNRLVSVRILEDEYSGDPIRLMGSDNPLELDYGNAEFDKMTGIRESKARISFMSIGVTVDEFLTESDTDLKVEIYFNNDVNPQWVGWVDSQNLNTKLLDTSEVIDLSASDGLNFLKETELSDFDNGQLWGVYRVKDLITYCLKKTKLDLNFTSHIDILPQGADDRSVNWEFDAFYYAHLSSLTFITGPRSFDDCFTVLSKILDAFRCTLFQSVGSWQIVHEDERLYRNAVAATTRDSSFGTPGESISYGNTVGYTLGPIEIGLTKPTKLINADAVKSWARPYKYVALNYEFRMPSVLFRNWDLKDGDFVSPPSTASRLIYTVEHWTDTLHPNTSTGGPAYIAVEYDTTNKIETQRYLKLDTGTDFLNEYGIQTNGFFVNKDDSLSLSYDTREKNTGFVNSGQFVYVKLVVSPSLYYTLDLDGNWYANVMRRVGYNWSAPEDRRNWKTFSITSAKFPDKGFLTIDFTSIGHSRTASNEVHYKNLSASINYAFSEKFNAKGHEYKVSQDLVVKNVHEQTVYISNAINSSLQGAIIDEDYNLVSLWQRPGEDEARPFLQHIARVYYRMVKRNFIKVEGAMFNLFKDGLLHTLLFNYSIEGIPDVLFMPTTMRTNVKNESCEFTFIEIVNTSNNDDESVGTESFKYIDLTQEVFDPVKEDKKPIDWRFGIIGWGVQMLTRARRRKFNGYN